MEDKENKKDIIHKVTQHDKISVCGKNTTAETRSETWDKVTCPLCLKVRRPRGIKRW